MAFYAIGAMMLEVNAFSVIMLISLSSIIGLGIWCNIPDFKECKKIIKEIRE
jgi:hypothetical protein